MKKISLVIAIITFTMLAGFYACNRAKKPSANREGLAVISCKPAKGNCSINTLAALAKAAANSKLNDE
jgi:hypothetical protein